MNGVLGRLASTSQELAHYHSGEGRYPFSIFWFSISISGGLPEIFFEAGYRNWLECTILLN